MIRLAPIGFLGVLNFGVMIAVQKPRPAFSLPSGRGALIFATFPFFTLLFSTVLGFERMSLAKLIGVLLTVVGVAMTASFIARHQGTTRYGSRIGVRWRSLVGDDVGVSFRFQISNS